LPPFSALTTDEEGEMKAELKKPETYHVIANPKSFESLPEYRDEGTSSFERTPASKQSSPVHDGEGSASCISGCLTEDLEDPNTVILKVFEEIVPGGSTQLSNIPTKPSDLVSSHIFPTYPLQHRSQGLGIQIGPWLMLRVLVVDSPSSYCIIGQPFLVALLKGEEMRICLRLKLGLTLP
jgi:hypothetical protein